jgi:hypothetical protein
LVTNTEQRGSRNENPITAGSVDWISLANVIAPSVWPFHGLHCSLEVLRYRLDTISTTHEPWSCSEPVESIEFLRYPQNVTAFDR